MSSVFRDMMGREVIIPSYPERIISLVPSQTETLYHLGLGARVVGRTKFCIHPGEARLSAKVIGGTKYVHYDKIDKLRPDLIIGNKEENTREIVEALEGKYPVWMSDISSFEDALTMISLLGVITGVPDSSHQLVSEISRSITLMEGPRIGVRPLRVLYLIWYAPWMGAAKGTFIDHMITLGGWENCLKDQDRYPELTIEAIKAYHPDVVFFSSEPFPFKDKHVAELKNELKEAKMMFVDGEMFSWYGSRLLKGLAYLVRLKQDLTWYQSDADTVIEQ
jgi:ABC-type Fe3+-hydroxamate transport system substrate-binding protein